MMRWFGMDPIWWAAGFPWPNDRRDALENTSLAYLCGNPPMAEYWRSLAYSKDFRDDGSVDDLDLGGEA